MTGYVFTFHGVMTIPAESKHAAETKLNEVTNWLPYPTQIYQTWCEEEFELDKKSST